MDDVSQVSEFGKIFIFLVMGVIFVLITFLLGKLVAPNNPSPEKNTSYECGEDPKGSSWIQFNSRFYVIALVFLIFDVEMVFIFPWATVFGQEALIAADARWGWLSLIEMFIFVGILLLGLVYVWVKGDLNWIRMKPVQPTVDSNIPASVYDRLNQEVYVPKKYIPAAATEVNVEPEVKPASPRPGFKPMFRPKPKE